MATPPPTSKTRGSFEEINESPSHSYDLEEQGVSPQPPPAARGGPCPKCTKPLPSRDATLCVECGYNLKTGKKTSLEVVKPKKPGTKKPSKIGSFLASRLTSGKFLGGLASLVGGIVWLVVGLMAGRLFFYPIFLVMAGIVGVLFGLLFGDD